LTVPFTEHTGFGQVFGDVGEVIEDQEVVLVDLGDGGFESQFAAGDLKPLDEIGGPSEQDAPAVFEEGRLQLLGRRRIGSGVFAFAPAVHAGFGEQVGAAAFEDAQAAVFQAGADGGDAQAKVVDAAINDSAHGVRNLKHAQRLTTHGSG